MTLFKSYAVICLAIGASICEVLFVFYSYPNDDLEPATFDRPIILLAITVVQLWCKILVSVHDWLKQVTHVCKR